MDLQNILVSLAEAELSLWNTLIQNGNRFEGVPREFEELRISNTEALDKIIQQHGWPGYSLGGKKARTRHLK